MQLRRRGMQGDAMSRSATVRSEKSAKDMAANRASVSSVADKLPRLAEIDLVFARQIYGSQTSADFAAHGREYWWEWDHQGARFVAQHEVVLASEPASALLRLSDHGWFGETDAYDWGELSGMAQLLAWSLRYEPIVDQINRRLGQSFTPKAIVAPAEQGAMGEARRDLGFVVYDKLDHVVLRGTLCVPPSIAVDGVTAVDENRRIRFARWGGVPIKLWPVVGAIEVPYEGAMDLEPGDVVNLGSRSRIADGMPLSLRVADSDYELHGTFNGASIVLERPALQLRLSNNTSQKGDVVMSSESPRKAAKQDGGDLRSEVAALPVTLEFRVGELVLTAGELAALSPGYVFTLGARLEDSPVTITANGKPFATGELVLVNDLLGVRLNSRANRGSSEL